MLLLRALRLRGVAEEIAEKGAGAGAVDGDVVGLGNMRVQLPPPGAKKPDDAKALPRQ